MLQEENKLSLAVITDISFAAVEFMILQCSFYIVDIWTLRFLSTVNEYGAQWGMKNYKEYIWNSHNMGGKEVEELLNSDRNLVHIWVYFTAY